MWDIFAFDLCSHLIIALDEVEQLLKTALLIQENHGKIDIFVSFIILVKDKHV